MAPPPPKHPREQLTIEGVAVENYFSPELKVAPIIADAVSQAKEEILFMAFSFTAEQIGEAMLARAAAGVDVRGVFETVGSSSEYSYYGPMRISELPNIQVRQDGNRRVMHHKVIILDRETVIFGSFNFSESANSRNDENYPHHPRSRFCQLLRRRVRARLAGRAVGAVGSGQ
ncbi:MAG: phospholipase D-like domain-containing protein [Chloroflexi bacterium]|nr:phospholipase D-like domain-containing protein [Chloroflexota bacterium]